MSVESRSERAEPHAPGRSIHVVRALKLLYGGAVGGLVATVLCLVAFTIAYGPHGLLSAALAAALVLFFYGVGQYVMVVFADAGARTLLMVALSSYTARIATLGFVLLVYSTKSAGLPQIVPMAVFVTVMAVVAGWLTAEVWVFSRLRIGVYDTEYVAPSTSGSAQ